MNKVFKIISIILITIYVLIILFLSIFILLKNDYGITKYKDNYYIIINGENENAKNKDGMLVVVKEKDIKDLKENDEIFLYKSDNTNKVYVGINKINKVYSEEKEPYITVDDELAVYREDTVIGTSIKKINLVGKIIDVLTNKWIFLIFIVMPCIVFAVYIIFSIIKNYAIKSGTLSE